MDRRWTMIEALTWTTRHLAANGIDSARLESERLLSVATGLSRVELYAQHDRPLTEQERAAYKEAIRRRVAGEPLQFIVGEVPFRHIVLKVGPGVFIPRPETEILVETVLRALAERPSRFEPTRVLDLCTGSGAVALSIARELAGTRVVAVDVASAAVHRARDNARRLRLAEAVEVRQGDLFEAVDAAETFDAVVANPPYVPTEALPGLAASVADHEPREALDGGEKGLAVIRRIVTDAPPHLEPGGVLAMEVDVSHVAAVRGIMEEAGFEGVAVEEDLAGRPRVVAGRATGR